MNIILYKDSEKYISNIKNIIYIYIYIYIYIVLQILKIKFIYNRYWI